MQSIERKRVLVQTSPIPFFGLSVCPEGVLWQTADWIWMPFGVMSGVGRGMSVLDGAGDGAILGVNLGVPL